jgi:hypothetical protein
VKQYVSRKPSGAKAIAATSITEIDRSSGEIPSFKKAMFGFFGSITFLYVTAFYLSSVL